MKKHLYCVVFELEEEVTPAIFAGRVNEACHAYYTIREGERVISEMSVKLKPISPQNTKNKTQQNE